MSGITEYERELAKNLMAAAIATQMGVGLSYARKHHIDQNPEGDPGLFWIALARTVIEVRNEGMADLLKAVAVAQGANR